MSLNNAVLVLMLCAGAFLVSVFPVDSGQELMITENPHVQHFPKIYQDIVVWEDNRNQNWDIYAYNLSTHEEFQITTDKSDQTGPAIYRNIIVWKDRRAIDAPIYGYNLVTQQEFFIRTTSTVKSDLALYQDIIVWGSGSRIYAYNLTTQEEYLIAEDSRSRENPAIHNDIIIWAGWDDGIFGYNITTKEEFQILPEQKFQKSSLLNQKTPALYNDIVIWTEGDHGAIYGYNLSTEKRLVIATARLGKCDKFTAQYITSRNPVIYEDVIVWVDCRNGNEDIYLYNLLQNKEFQVTSHESFQRSPALYEDTLVWQDYRNGNWDIYSCNLTSCATETLFKSRTGLLIRDNIIELFIAGLLLFIVVDSGMFLWNMKIYNDSTKEMHTRKAELTDFKRAKGFTTSSIATAVTYGVVGSFMMIMTYSSRNIFFLWGLFMFVFSIFFLPMSFYNWKIPYIRITDDKIMVFTSASWKPKIIPWNMVKDINFHKKDKIELHLSNGKKVTLRMYLLDVDYEVLLVQALKQYCPSGEAV